MEDIRERPRRRIRAPRDFFGGLALMAVAALAWWGARDLSGSQGVNFGAGTAPRLFAGLLFLTGAAVAAIGLLKDGPPIGRYGIRGPLLVGASIVLFAVGIRPLGLPLASFLTILVASAASDETRWLEGLVWAAVLSVFCTLLFVHALGLSLPLWPGFLDG
jgi:putative tricarboxylic transport membrane protein